MPIVPDDPDAGRDAERPAKTATGGPLGRAAPCSATRRRRSPCPAPRPRLPSSAGRPQPPQKKRAGRDLRAAIGVGVGLGAVIVASLFVVKAVFVGVIAVAVVVGLWELTSRLQERKGIKAPLVPLAVGGAAMVVAGYVRGAEGAWVAMALTGARRAGLADDRTARGLPQGRHGGRLRGVLRAVPGHVRRDDAHRRRRPAARAHLPAADRRQRHRRVRGRLALRQAQARAAHQPREDPRGAGRRGGVRDGRRARCACSS